MVDTVQTRDTKFEALKNHARLSGTWFRAHTTPGSCNTGMHERKEKHLHHENRG